MEMLTSTPRLQSSAIIGKRFTVEADDTVKRHLDELNRLLGKSIFVENLVNKPKDIDEEFADQKEQVETVEAEAEKLKLVSENSSEKLASSKEEKIIAETELDDLTDRIGDAKAKLEILKENPKQNAVQIRQLTAEIKQLQGEHRAKAKEVANANISYDAAENEANNDKVNANDKLLEAQRLRRDLTNDMLNFAKNGPVMAENEQFDLQSHLRKSITPKRTNDPEWAEDSFLNFTSKADVDDEKLSISECIDMVNELASLKNSLKNYIDKSWNSLSDNQKIILDSKYKNIADYLLAYGYWVKGITEVNSMFNFIVEHPRGCPTMIVYATVSSVRNVIKRNAIRINDYNNDSHQLLTKIAASKANLKKENFLKDVDKHLKEFIKNRGEVDLLEFGLNELKIDDLSESEYPEVIRMMRNSSIKLDKDNIRYFLPGFINSISSNEIYDETAADDEYEISDEEFEVTFVRDERTITTANAKNVKCAGQLFTSMVMETELDIIGLADFFSDYYLSRNRIQIDDDRLRASIELLMFDNQFLHYDKKNNVVVNKERTLPEKRMSVYKMVFNYGGGQALHDSIANTKFPKLWRKLIPVVKEYVENSASSLSQNSFVSKGGVMSLVSALQTNLSTVCNNVATVMSPRIYQEWNFIILKIFSHPEIIRQISPTVPSWKGVVETLYANFKRKNVDASLVYEKAELCNNIIEQIAAYNPIVFEEDDNFLNFCSMVIQLDENNNSIEEFLEEMDELTEKPANRNNGGYGSANGAQNQYAKEPEAVGADEWDF